MKRIITILVLFSFVMLSGCVDRGSTQEISEVSYINFTNFPIQVGEDDFVLYNVTCMTIDDVVVQGGCYVVVKKSSISWNTSWQDCEGPWYDSDMKANANGDIRFINESGGGADGNLQD